MPDNRMECEEGFKVVASGRKRIARIPDGTSKKACVAKQPNTVPPTARSDLTFVFDEPARVKSTTVIFKADVDEYDDGSPTLCQLMTHRALARALAKITTEIVSVKRMARGDVSVTAKTVEAAKTLLQVTELDEHFVTPHEPESLMRTCGVIYGIDLDIEMNEIEDELKPVLPLMCSAVRLTRGPDKVPTKSVLLTFTGQSLPDHVVIFFQRFPIRIYVPPALRCFKCQSFGHVSAKCRSTHHVCAKCGGKYKYEECNESSLKCKNCGGAHSAAYKGCIKYQEAVQIQKVRVEGKLSYSQAVRQVRGDFDVAQVPAVPKPPPAAKPLSQVVTISGVVSSPVMVTASTQTETLEVECQTDPVVDIMPESSCKPLFNNVSPVDFLNFVICIVANLGTTRAFKSDGLQMIASAAQSLLGLTLSPDDLTSMVKGQQWKS
ncbi:uncharacterized protein LOC125379308 [Haliotis rufescens]|uniref:uncharacterized protein LOC125379308 n=1 Tax=Haliotis rufescens TaxID=6454 RepID=UPI00201F5697|nr:uncharacterized protein LOC125379308 [Haliotis rufescens]